MAHRVIDTPDQMEDFIRLLGNLKLPITVQWAHGRDRTLDQNALQWLWASEVAGQLERDVALQRRVECPIDDAESPHADALPEFKPPEPPILVTGL